MAWKCQNPELNTQATSVFLLFWSCSFTASFPGQLYTVIKIQQPCTSWWNQRKGLEVCLRASVGLRNSPQAKRAMQSQRELWHDKTFSSDSVSIRAFSRFMSALGAGKTFIINEVQGSPVKCDGYICFIFSPTSLRLITLFIWQTIMK